MWTSFVNMFSSKHLTILYDGGGISNESFTDLKFPIELDKNEIVWIYFKSTLDSKSLSISIQELEHYLGWYWIFQTT